MRRDPSLNDPFGFSRRTPRAFDHLDPSGDTSKQSAIPSTVSSDIENEDRVSHVPSSLGQHTVDVPLVRWSDMDFPPLGNAAGSPKTGSGVWSRKTSTGENTRSPSAALSEGAYSMSSDLPDDGHGNGEHGQELEIPPTPGLGRSPLTPKTPGSGFPATPTSANDNGILRPPLKDSEGKPFNYYDEFASRERDIDPTTLFVGGLETFGPGAWDEDKVTKFFARFGGLESVKIVRPPLFSRVRKLTKDFSITAYTRGVLCEFSYATVILRGGRGGITEGVDVSISIALDPTAEARTTLTSYLTEQILDMVQDEAEASGESEPPVYSEAIAPKAKEESTEDTVPSSHASRPSSPGPPFTSLTPITTENYREWYDEPLSTALTPPPSSFGSSASAPLSAPVIPYMTGGYYPPAPWVHPYGQAIQYPMHYGYPGYPIPGQQQVLPSFPRPPGSDGSVAPTPGPWPPMGMYGSYIPYATQPQPRTPNLETPPSQHLNNRAPLAPTGFIQNEQGTLIAVYQPEALDQYMAGAHAAPPALQQPSAQNLPTWPQYPQSAYSFAAPTVPIPTRPSLPPVGNGTWMQNTGFNPVQPVHSTPHIPQTPNITTGLGGFRSGYSDISGTTPQVPPFRRQAARRDQNGPQTNNGRNNQSRSFPNRNARGTVNNGGYRGQDSNHNGIRNAPFIQNSNEWNQWGAGR
ncbi:hypothetical protein H0H81_007456 [Sphagnurus paluster]|uniref:Uncharacterized protein n=1 Tax=Sphagnurus paluster TaxID=117069 RepID=A0A9P7GWI9_9AGAR|nr:hypothetical protein H0H81_007456 [Sphagnurus paluster]